MVATRDEIIRVILEELEVDETTISEDVSFDSLGVDSPGRLEIVIAIEETFGIQVADKDLASLHTVGDLVTYVTKSRKSQ